MTRTAPRIEVPEQPPVPLARIALIAASAAMAGFLFGYDSAVINGGITGIQKHFNIGAGTTGTVVAVALLGSALGALFAGRLADRYGRIKVMYLAGALFAFSSVGAAVPFSVWELGLFRFLAGIAIGLASVIGPTYIAEVAPAAHRGRLASFQQMGIVLGITVSQLVNYGIAQWAGGKSENQLGALQAWQWMLLVCFVPAAIYLWMATRIPESPRWLVGAGQVEQAQNVLVHLEGDAAQARLAQICGDLERATPGRLREILHKRYLFLPIVWAGIGIALFQQLVGINVIFYYSSILWQSVGIDQSSSLFYSITTSLVNIVGTLLAMVLIDRVGRKPLALVGSAGMTVSLAVAAWAFSYKSGAGEKISIPEFQGTVALVAAHAFVFFFAVSWGVVLWVMIGEMFPLKIRGIAISVATAANWLANWAVTESFPRLSEWNLSATYVMYALFAAASFLFVARVVKETKGRELSDMG